MTDILFNRIATEDPFLMSQRIVLCRPSHPGNIGAVARAMKTMGLVKGCQLYLVNPLCDIDDVAIRRASGAADLLAECRIVRTIEEALVSCLGAFGMTVRARDLGPEPLSPSNAVEVAYNYWQQNQGKSVCSAYVFGNETNGLTNEELMHCRSEVSISTNPAYGSLNLAAAVQIVTYLLRERSGNKSAVDSGATRYSSSIATVDSVEGFYQQLKSALVDSRFHDPLKPGRLMPKIRRIFDRAHLEKEEVNILRGIVTALSSSPKKVD